MPTCYRLESNLACRYWCRWDWIFCHNHYENHCRNFVVDHKCENGWHITKTNYKRRKKAAQFFNHRESQASTWKRDPQREDDFVEELPKAKKYKGDALLEIYLKRFGFKPEEMPDCRDLEGAFMHATYMTQTSQNEEISTSEFTYREYSEAFQYIMDTIKNPWQGADDALTKDSPTKDQVADPDYVGKPGMQLVCSELQP